MDYNPPVGGSAGDPYIDGNPTTGTEGSIPPAASIEFPQREIVAAITAAGLTPDNGDLEQLASAIQLGTLGAAIASGVNVISATFNPPITALHHGMVLCVRATAANTSTTPTFTPTSGSIPAKTIVKGAGQPLVAGDVAGAGHWIVLRYDLTLDKWVMQNPAKGVSVSVAPTGSIIVVPSNSAPSGYIKANGALLSRTTYADLWAYAQASGNLAASDGAWGDGQFSPGDGATTFRIPDYRGNHVRGWDDGRGIDSGRGIGTLQLDAVKSHTHAAYGASDGAAGSGVGNLSGPYAPNNVTGATGGSENRVRNIAHLICIKY